MTVAGAVRRAWRRVVWALALVLAAGGAWPAASPPPKQLQPLAAASAPPPLELKDLAGTSHRLGDYRGKVVLVNFWATWCEPCRDEMPSMQALTRRTDREGGQLVILAVNYAENVPGIERFLSKHPLDFPVLLDPFSEVWRAWKPGVLPASFLIGRDGKLHYRVVGELDWAGPAAAAAIERLMREKP